MVPQLRREKHEYAKIRVRSPFLGIPLPPSSGAIKNATAVCILLRTCLLASLLGRGAYMTLSNRPGLSNALSTASGRLVAPTTMTPSPFMAPTPSISVRNVASTRDSAEAEDPCYCANCFCDQQTSKETTTFDRTKNRLYYDHVLLRFMCPNNPFWRKTL